MLYPTICRIQNELNIDSLMTIMGFSEQHTIGHVATAVTFVSTCNKAAISKYVGESSACVMIVCKEEDKLVALALEVHSVMKYSEQLGVLLVH